VPVALLRAGLVTASLAGLGSVPAQAAAAAGESPLGDSLVAWVTETCEAVSVELKWLGLDDAWVAVGDSFQWEGRPCTARPAVRLTVVREGDVFAHRTVKPGLDIHVEAPVAVASVRAGEMVRVTTGVVLVQELRGEPVSASTGAEWQARVRIAEGAPVTSNLVVPMPDALSGAAVTVVVHRGTLTITAPGRLLEDAHLGRSVRVVNDSTRVALEGVLAAPGTVEIP